MKLNLFLPFLLISSFLFSQVGINTNTPNPNSNLHVSERNDPNSSNDPDNYSGIIIQRYTTSERDKLTYSDYPTNSSIRLNKFDNSLMIFNTTENCYNYWNFDEQEWKSLCGNLGNAKITFDCNLSELKGNYVRGKEVDGTNYIQISVNVTKPGNYQIMANSSSNNGYSFVGQGTFVTTGKQIVKLSAQGTPIGVQQDNFDITSSQESSQSKCSISVQVKADISNYSLNCSSAIVNGTYVKGTALSSNNTISMNVNVSSLGSYDINTNLINGVRFSASGTFTTTGTQTITLIGTGTPTVNSSFDVNIVSNTVDGNATCSVNIPLTLPAMTYAIIGTSDYSWNNVYRKSAFNSSSFGVNGKVKIIKLNQLWSQTDVNAAASSLNGSGEKPDIILYYSYGANPNSNITTALNNYIAKGGVVIYGSSDNTAAQTNILLQGIYGTTNPPVAYDRGGNSSQNDYQINNNPNDPIINGPFGNLSSKYWGEDNSGSVFVRNLPSTATQIASANNQYSNNSINPEHSILWYDDHYNFAYVGDSVAAAWDTNTSTTGWAAVYNQTTGFPIAKSFGYWNSGTAGNVFVFNSAMDLNLVAWALQKAATSGINKH